MLVDKKQYDEAEGFLISAVRKDEKNAGNYWYLGKAYAAKRKNRQAIDNFELFLKYAAKDDANRDKARDQITKLKRL
jgi:cytochrome c-type biogenesis protein CcmH/NrfG